MLLYTCIAYFVNNMTKFCKNAWRVEVQHGALFVWIRMEVSCQVQALTA